MSTFFAWTTDHQSQLVPLVFGFVALYLLLPREHGFLRPAGILIGLVGLGGLSFTLLPPGLTLHGLMFYIFSGTAIVAATVTVTHHNPVYSALSFALTTLSVCGLFLLRGAQFLAAATVLIYAGAIIVTFLFIMMLAQQSGKAGYDRRAREPLLATLATFVLLGGLLFTINDWVLQRAGNPPAAVPPGRLTVAETADTGGRSLGGFVPIPKGTEQNSNSNFAPGEAGRLRGLGRSLFTDYLVAVELGGTLLLVAGVGAVAIARADRRGSCNAMTSELTNYLIVGAVLFSLGALGFITRRNLIIAVLSTEMMLLGVTLNLVAFSYEHATYQGQVFTAIVLTVAACEAGLALALVSALYRRRKTLDISVWSDLGEPDVEFPLEKGESQSRAPEATPHYPRLTPAGHMPETVWPETPTHV